MSRKIYVKKANKEKTDEICKDICDGYVATMVNSDDIWEIAHRSAMEMADWKDRQMLYSLLRIFDLIMNDEFECVQYIIDTLQAIINDHNPNATKEDNNETILHHYCILKCNNNKLWNACMSLGTCDDYDKFKRILRKNMTNEEKAEKIANNNCTHICLADCSAESYFSSENDCYKTAMEMAEWKEKEMLDCAVAAYCECCDTKECEDYFDMGCECDWKLKFEKKLLKKIKK